jgi:hypothetical protein
MEEEVVHADHPAMGAEVNMPGTPLHPQPVQPPEEPLPLPPAIPQQDEDLKLTLPQLLDTPTGVLTVVLDGLALLGMLPFIWIELCTITSYGLWQWATIWNLMDVSAYALQVGWKGSMHQGRQKRL